MKIEKYQYVGKVYNIEVEPNHEVKDDQFYINARNGIVVHNCHPRDNIALRWLADHYDIGYDLFDTIMHAREIQAKNLALFLVEHSKKTGLPIVIHGKAYKPDVEYCIGSYSTLVGHYVKEAGCNVCYVDPLADNQDEVIAEVNTPAIYLWAHNRKITYEYTGDQKDTQAYCTIVPGSIIVDPWRKLMSTDDIQVIHYGNTRHK